MGFSLLVFFLCLYSRRSKRIFRLVFCMLRGVFTIGRIPERERERDFVQEATRCFNATRRKLKFRA